MFFPHIQSSIVGLRDETRREGMFFVQTENIGRTLFLLTFPIATASSL